MRIYPLIFLGLISSDNLIADGFDKANDLVDGFNRILQLVVSTEALINQGLSKKESVPLIPPRRDYGITPEDVQRYLRHSILSKCTASQLQNGRCYCEGKFQEPVLFNNRTIDSQSVVAIDPTNKLVVISYRVTVSEKNWESNLKSGLVPHPYINGPQRVHDGYLEYVSSLYRQMEPTVVRMLRKHPSYKLHITGYSLGGCVSFISLPFWMYTLKTRNLKNKVQVFSYAGPRPGNVEFAKYVESLNIPIARYSQKGDVVPQVIDQFRGYSQVGLEFYDSSLPLIRKSFVRCSLNVIEDKNCSLKDRHFHGTIHLTPFQRPLPMPVLC
ncbi:hypothetical protein DSO57_1030082 [Entomophthora muscae]|uniref:Uncharacterized protein n=1 Tax=Entomophthora muscae TaxID=34485 RepID=A0ACC2TN71_9FUNG|nr:hypothetical protein DSO57_1030082 [Entomophthora muscae]